MNNKNCANYTDFTEQHYQRKIVQAPGGESHFSIGWSSEKTDYGPPRNSRSLGKQREPASQEGSYGRAPTYGNQPYQPPQGSYGQQGSYAPQAGSYAPQSGYPPAQYAQQPTYQLDPEPIYQLKQPTQHSGKQEGSYAPVASQKTPSSTNLYSAAEPEEIDRMARQYERKKLETPQQAQTPQQQQRPPRPPSNPTNSRPKDTNKTLEQRKGYHQEPPGVGSYAPQSRSVERISQQQYVPAEEFKPSVRVHNPPGGRSNFQLG